MKLTLCALSLLAVGDLPAQEITTEEVTFEASAVTSKAFLALPKSPGPHPAILVAPEWWGHNDYVRMRAEMLAKLGYAALAMDLYGNGKVAHEPQSAFLYDSQVKRNSHEMNARFLATLNYLAQRPEVDGERIAAIGYGSGGDICLQMARNGMRGLDGVVAFHPFFTVRPSKPPIRKASAKVLVCNAGEDPYVHLQKGKVAAFKKEMASVETDLTIIDFPKAMQSFSVPGADKIGKKFNIPHVYDAKADASSWKALQNFLTELWKPAEKAEKAE